ncbi:hypothetical protein ACLOJK_001903 [Asimina triloba]
MAELVKPIPRLKTLVTRSKKKYLEEGLYKALFKEGSKEETVRRELNRFLKGTKKAQKWEVTVTLRKLRRHNQFSTALKLKEVPTKIRVGLLLSAAAAVSSIGLGASSGWKPMLVFHLGASGGWKLSVFDLCLIDSLSSKMDFYNALMSALRLNVS